jgi:ABC-type Fe3+ transport system permease subunit
MTVLGAARGRGHADTAARRRTWITRPGTYLVILFVLAITLVPMLYLILSGFRTTGQLGSNPNGLPHPWVWSNYASILESAVFWQAVLNSAIIAVVATALAMCSARRPPSRCPGMPSAGATDCSSCSRPGCCSRSIPRPCRCS